MTIAIVTPPLRISTAFFKYIFGAFHFVITWLDCIVWYVLEIVFFSARLVSKTEIWYECNAIALTRHIIRWLESQVTSAVQYFGVAWALCISQFVLVYKIIKIFFFLFIVSELQLESQQLPNKRNINIYGRPVENCETAS